MIKPDKRKAIYLLHQQGMGVREIARRLIISANTVMSIIDQKGQMPETIRKDKIEIDPELLTRLYDTCQGRMQRIHEKLTEEHGVCVAYPTLTKIIRDLGFGKKPKARCHKVPDEPGVEMQHDTSPYRIKLGDKFVLVQGSLIYFRYSKVRYLKFYRAFNRFAMKCFFYEALTFWEYAAIVCIIDNTNLARLHGTGANAVIVPEMAQFAKQFGFEFICHEKGHANRKAGNERGFYTVETNFFPGRTFEDLEDMNHQAFDWATRRMPNRPVGKSRMIPAAAFEQEKPYLIKLPPYVEPPYQEHERGTDQYGYISFEGNFYWVPGTRRDVVKALSYSDHLKIYHHRQLLGQYKLPRDGAKNEVIYPDGVARPSQKPKYRKKPTTKEEQLLRKAAPEIDAYLSFALPAGARRKHRFIRGLYGLYRKVALPVLIKTVKRALKYRIADIGTLERIAVLQLRNDDIEVPMTKIDPEYQNRTTYLDGYIADEPDLDLYDKLAEDDEND
ncbi:MAG: helix-turn-helix domain-containing protein [Desulfobacterales bacterium]|jgi:transposase